MYEESSDQQAGYEKICEGLLGALLALVQRLVEPNVSRKQDSDHLAVRIKEYLDENYPQHLKLQDIAAHFHMIWANRQPNIRKVNVKNVSI